MDEWRSQGIAVYDPRSDLSFAECLQRTNLQPDVDAPGAERLYFCHRRTSQEDIYFLNNHSDEAVSGSFRFRTAATRAELWHPVTGQHTPLVLTADHGRTAVDLTLAPRESYFVVLSSGEAPDVAAKPEPGDVHDTQMTLSGPWTVSFDESVGGPSEPVVFDTLTDWTSHSDPRIRYYAGTATYTNDFHLARKDRHGRYRLHFQQPVGSAVQVIVNGHDAGTLWCSPWQVDVTPFVKKGRNLVELRVANCLWNRLVGDANRPEQERIMQQTTPLAKPTDRLDPAGIVGSVTLSY